MGKKEPKKPEPGVCRSCGGTGLRSGRGEGNQICPTCGGTGKG